MDRNPYQNAPQAYSREVANRTAALYEKVSDIIPSVEWPFIAPLVDDILRLKKQRNAIVLSHNYQTPDIYHCIADIVGDSLQLANAASHINADVIVMCGVHFMAETVKVLNPSKTVLIPDLEAGCSLASSITGADVRQLRTRYPGIPVVSYVNTTADVKAESDACCTSANARRVVESFGVGRVILLPDEYLAKNVARETNIEIITWHGRCEVHERFSPADIAIVREAYPGAMVVTHPESAPDVVQAADFSGSTSQIQTYLKETKPSKVALLTECSMADNISADLPNTQFVRPCNLCPHMKKITLHNVRDALLQMKHEISVDPSLILRARQAIERMIAVGRQ